MTQPSPPVLSRKKLAPLGWLVMWAASILATAGVITLVDDDTPPPVTTTTIAPTTAKPTTTTAKPTTTVRPTTTTSLPPATGFPTAATTGVPAGTVLKPWPYSWDSRSCTACPTEVIDGLTYKVIDGYLFQTSSQYLYLGDANTLVRNSRFVHTGTVSNTSAIIQGNGNAIILTRSEIEGNWNRGIQSDNAHLTVSFTKMHNVGDAGVEKNDRNGRSDYTVADNYIVDDGGGWPRVAHVDGVQVGGARNVTIRHNTILVGLWGGAVGDTSYVSNSALGLWAELGNVTGTVTITGNQLAGGGRTIYLEQKSPYRWQGPVNVTGNVFNVAAPFGPHSAVWSQLHPAGLPAQLTWTGNTTSDGKPLSLAQALAE